MNRRTVNIYLQVTIFIGCMLLGNIFGRFLKHQSIELFALMVVLLVVIILLFKIRYSR